MSAKWITPFLKQCFVTAGVSLNMASGGLVMGYSSVILEQLKAPGSAIPIDDSSGSWLAALPGISLVVGNFIVPSIMAKFGRKTANLISIMPLVTGWMCLAFATNIYLLLVGRFFQGLCMGMCTSLGSLLIGEYTSPHNRGAFLMTLSVAISIAVLLVHVLGAYLNLYLVAMICAGIGLVDMIIVICSPESPAWLADQERYDDCKRVFRWLRGDTEENELKEMIEASIIVNEAKKKSATKESFMEIIKRKIGYFKTTVVKKEFYKPIIIMMHVYNIAQWSGINILVSYASELFHRILDVGANTPVLIMTLDAHRIIANIFAIYIIKKMKRRAMFFTTVGINIIALLATAAYTFAREKQALPFESPLVPVILTHILMFSLATGSLSLCFIIGGEIFPLEFKNFATGISVPFYSGNMFLSVKTVPYFFNNLGVHGTYLLYACILSYCLVVVYFLLPETKDRTLQDIEDEFRGKKLSPLELQSEISVSAWKARVSNADRRCSSPVVL